MPANVEFPARTIIVPTLCVLNLNCPVLLPLI